MRGMRRRPNLTAYADHVMKRVGVEVERFPLARQLDAQCGFLATMTSGRFDCSSLDRAGKDPLFHARRDSALQL